MCHSTFQIFFVILFEINPTSLSVQGRCHISKEKEIIFIIVGVFLLLSCGFSLIRCLYKYISNERDVEGKKPDQAKDIQTEFVVGVIGTIMGIFFLVIGLYGSGWGIR